MSSVVVIGAQWGDEGKGKIVDWLSQYASAVVRFHGGNNAGHTIVTGDKVYKLNLLPSSVLRPGKLSIIGNGVALDPYALIEEIINIQHSGIDVGPDNLMIAENTPLILSVHKQADELFEKLLGNSSIGTTRKGIGPCYQDKVARRAIRLCDLLDTSCLEGKVENLLLYHNLLRKGMGLQQIARNELIEELITVANKIIPYAQPTWRVIHQMVETKQRIIFEGAQGSLLDIDHGTYPYVTSSNTVAGQVNNGCGVNLIGNQYVLGVVKAYTTRVGNGPFFTEQSNDVGERLFSRGKELGTVSSRRRRCGWFDAVSVRQAVQLSGVSGLALTKLDILDDFNTLNVCTSYQYRGKTYDYLPSSPDIQQELQPVYEELPGWKSNTRGLRSLSGLPQNAVGYIRRLEELIGVPVKLISTSPDRDDITVVDDSFLSL